MLREHGCVLFEGVLAAPEVLKLQASFLRRYRRYFHDREHPDALQVGQQRFMIPVRLRPPFSVPGVYANPFVLPVLRRVLGPECILGSFGSVVALPGSPDQHVHRDHPALFDDPALDAALPAFALTMVLPLVELNETNGTTRLWQGSHRLADAEAERLEPVSPFVELGSCLLFDYRLRHGGTQNRSGQVRPVLYNVYQRAWFRDSRNFRKLPPLRISPKAFRQVPEAYRALFATAQISRWYP